MDAATAEVRLAPVAGKERIAVLDVLRGVAILGIFFMNIPLMAGPTWLTLLDPRAMGWSGADQTAWSILHVTWNGTQRGMLEFLFGAGLMVTARKAMAPDGPVAVADLYIRRNLWLLAFGLFDIYLLMWPGDILHTYAIAALLLFPFRLVRTRWLIALGLTFAAFTAVPGAIDYAERSALEQRHAAALERQRTDAPASVADRSALADWSGLQAELDGPPPPIQPLVEMEEAARAGGIARYAQFFWASWHAYAFGQDALLFNVFEAFCAMLLGIAMWKLGFIQGGWRARDYALALTVLYALGMGARAIEAREIMAFSPNAQTGWFTHELARLAVSAGHVAAINLAMKAVAGRALLKPLAAAGQVAFSLYFLEQIIGLHVMFAPYGLHLPGGQGWAHLALQAGIVVAICLVAANVWLRWFAIGPLEWLWRSLSYRSRQPFRRKLP
jgi:uncharacterized protein